MADSRANKVINTPRQVVNQRSFEKGINVNDNNQVLSDESVYLSENFDLTTENRLQKRNGYTSVFTKAYKQAIVDANPEWGNILETKKGKIQSYHSFKQKNGETVEFWAIDGKLYKSPFLFENYPDGILWEIHDENDEEIEFSFQTDNKFEIKTIEGRAIFATGTHILEYISLNKKDINSPYILRKMKPYTPILAEYLDRAYGQNLLIPEEDRQQTINVDILPKNGFLGILPDPNVIIPSATPIKLFPIINQDQVFSNGTMTTQIGSRVLGTDIGNTLDFESAFEIADKFDVPSRFADNDNENYAELVFNSTSQYIIQGATYNSLLAQAFFVTATGLYDFKNNKILDVDDTGVISDILWTDYQTRPERKLLIATFWDGVYDLNNEQILSGDITGQIVQLIEETTGRVLVVTRLNGIFDLDGNLVQPYNPVESGSYFNNIQQVVKGDGDNYYALNINRLGGTSQQAYRFTIGGSATQIYSTISSSQLSFLLWDSPNNRLLCMDRAIPGVRNLTSATVVYTASSSQFYGLWKLKDETILGTFGTQTLNIANGQVWFYPYPVQAIWEDDNGDIYAAPRNSNASNAAALIKKDSTANLAGDVIYTQDEIGAISKIGGISTKSRLGEVVYDGTSATESIQLKTNIEPVADILIDNGKNWIQSINFSTVGVPDDPNAPEQYNLLIKVKYPDYDEYVDIIEIEPNDDSYHNEFFSMMWDFDDIQVIPRLRPGFTSGNVSNPLRSLQTVTITFIKDDDYPENYMSTYQMVLTPQLNEITYSENVNYVHDSTRIYYKDGYTMYYKNGNNENVNNTGVTIYISDINRPNYIPQYSTIDVPTQSNEKIQAISAWNTEIQNVIFMDGSIHLFEFNGIAEITVKQISNEVGLYAPYSVSLASNKLFFLGRNGIYALTTVQYSNAGANLTLLSKPILGLFYGVDGEFPIDSIGYSKNSDYYLMTPGIVTGELDENQEPIIRDRQFKLYTQSLVTKKPCWYMDQGKFIGYSQVVQNGDSFLFVTKDEANLLTPDVTAYVDGDLDQYFDDVDWWNSLTDEEKEENVQYPNNGVKYEIFETYLATKGFTVNGFENHFKSFRTATLGLGLMEQNVDLLISTSIDGAAKTNPIQAQAYINESGQVKIDKVQVSNFEVNIGTIPGVTRDQGTWIWGTSRWGIKTGAFNMIPSAGQGTSLQLIVQQVKNQASGYQILNVGTEMRIRKVRKNV